MWLSLKDKYGFFIFLLLICFFFTGCSTVYNPATGRSEFIVISTGEETAMGRQTHQQITASETVLADDVEAKRLERIGQRVAEVSDRQDYAYHFFLIKKDELNAFTTPGGYIYVYTGLMDKLGSDDRIAAVIAHEIGHGAARHIVKKFQAALGYSVASDLIFSRIGLGPTAQTLTNLGLNTVMSVVSKAYSRQDEYEADRLSIKYMYLSGYKVNAVVEVLEILQKESEKDNAPLFVRTHPYLKDRIKAATNEIPRVKERFGENKN